MKKQMWNPSDFLLNGVVTAPLIILAGSFAVSALDWRAESRKLSVAIEDIAGPGQTIDYATSANRYDQSHSPQQTETWKSVLFAAEELNGKYGGPFVWAGDDETYETLVPPDGDWPVAPVVSRYAADAEPIIEKIETLLNSDASIWLPIVFEGFTTNLNEAQQSRAVARLLRYCFLSAIHEANNERALMLVRASHRLYGSGYEPTFLIDELVRMACHSVMQSDLRQSLAAGVWSDDELRQLEPMVSEPFDWDRRWQLVIEADLLESFPLLMQNDVSIVDNQLTMIPLKFAPSTLRSILEQQTGIAQIGDVGSNEHVSAVETRMSDESKAEAVSADQWLQLPTLDDDWLVHLVKPYHHATANAFQKIASEQRFTRTVFALRKFRNQRGTWPKSLDELSRVGFRESEVQAFDGGPFAYEVGPDDRATLWNQANRGVKYAGRGSEARPILMLP